MNMFEITDGLCVLPKGVKEIEADVFRGRTDLTQVIIPASVTKIGVCAFRNCTNLRKVVIQEGVTRILSGAFKNCCSLSEIHIPSSVTFIDLPSAFENCSALEHISVCKDNPKYDSRNSCNAIIETETDRLVLGCSNTVFPPDIKSIGDGAFAWCEALRKIHILSSVNAIGSDSFYGCCSIEQITIDTENKVYDSRKGCNAIIETATDKLLFACKNTVIPDGVKEIASDAFESCEDLTEIAIPKSITKIPAQTFSQCHNLRKVTLPDSILEIRDSAFSGCESLTRIYIPDSMEIICDYTFYGCSSLKDLSIASSIKVIGRRAFADCISLERLVIPDSVIEIRSGAFRGCSNLRQLTLPKGVKIAKDAFEGCPVVIETDVEYYDSDVVDPVFADFISGRYDCY